MLQEWVASSERNSKLFNRLTSESYWEQTGAIDMNERLQKLKELNAPPIRKLIPGWLYCYRKHIAVLLLLAGCTCYFYIKNDNARPIQNFATASIDTGIIKNPLLLLANNFVIELNNSVVGPLARINGTEVKNKYREVKFDPVQVLYPLACEKQRNAQLLYNSFNTIITPKESQYFVTLPDGTEVALNKKSVLKFPTQFAGDQRVVKLSGEAYFKVKTIYDEVTRKKVPFIVNANKVQVKVLGTEFNIKAYEDSDSVRTTLVTGMVKIINDDITRILKPGEEVVVTQKGGFSETKSVDVSKAKNWRVEVNFKNAPIEEVMEHLSRNFPITVIYKTKIHTPFTVYIPPTGSLDTALQYVKITGVNFKTVGKNVFVIP
jgi:ferric-dicitrate binding protein FerR (iron transport regulator)